MYEPYPFMVNCKGYNSHTVCECHIYPNQPRDLYLSVLLSWLVTEGLGTHGSQVINICFQIMIIDYCDEYELAYTVTVLFLRLKALQNFLTVLVDSDI